MSCLSWVSLSVCLLGVLIAGVLGDEEKMHGGYHEDHDPMGDLDKMVDGERNKHRDHEAVIGSRHEAEEADELSPEQAKHLLEKLAKKHDTDNDGRISREEFMTWILTSFKSLDEEEAMERLKEEDKNEDGQLTWKEYVRQQYDYTLEDVKKMKDKPDVDDNKHLTEVIDDDERRFAAADLNHDGFLDKTEYVAFYHPYDYEFMHPFEIERGIKDYDKNHDNVVSMDEYIGEVEDKETRETEETQFKEYDKNGDGVLKGDELKKWLIQDNMDSAKEEVDHLMETADENSDGILTMEEILKHQEDFVSSQATDYGTTLEKMRDEL